MIDVGLLLRPRAYLAAGHVLASQNDTDPLPAVLRRGFAGLTVAVRPGPAGELFVGPGEPRPGRTLRRLVLSPLLAQARAGGGRLRGDQRIPFRLVVRFVGPTRDAATLLRSYRLLQEQLREYAPMLSRCLGGVPEPGVVTVAIAGIVDAREVLATQHERYAFADGSFDAIGSRDSPPELVPMISESWHRRFGWDGREPFGAEERHLLHALVRAAHQEGRTVCVADVPDGPARVRRAIWDEVLAAGVDVIADADQAALAGYLRRRSTYRPGARRRDAVLSR